MSADRPCAHCGSDLPIGSRSSRVYCSQRCTNAAAWARDPQGRAAANAEWRRQTQERRAAARLEAKQGRMCVECNAPLPPTTHADRMFCTRRCANARSLREKRAERYESSRRYRAARLAASAPGVQERDWLRLVRRYRGCCAYCGASGPMTQDHVVPLSRGGRHAIGNLLPACRSCNSAKRNDLLAYWRHGRPQARRRRPATST